MRYSCGIGCWGWVNWDREWTWGSWQVWDGCIGRRSQDVLLQGVNVVQVTLCGITHKKEKAVCIGCPTENKWALDKLTVAWLTLVKHEHLQQLKTKVTSFQQTIVHAMYSLQIKIKSPPFLRLPVWIASLLHVAKRLRSDCARRKKVYRLLHRKLVSTHVIKHKLMLQPLLSCVIYKFWPYLCHVDAHIIITIVT